MGHLNWYASGNLAYPPSKDFWGDSWSTLLSMPPFGPTIWYWNDKKGFYNRDHQREVSPVRKPLLNELLHDPFCARKFTISDSLRQLPCEKVVLDEFPLSLKLCLTNFISWEVVRSQNIDMLFAIHEIIFSLGGMAVLSNTYIVVRTGVASLNLLVTFLTSPLT